MTNEQKAKNMTKGFLKEGLIKKIRIQELLIKAMEWKDKQLIDKCKEFCDRQTTGEYYNRQGVFQIDKYIDDMLNFIKGE